MSSTNNVLTNESEVFVFVPSYNHAPFIERCLKSIIKQTLQPAKLLIIDDGSQDNSPQIIEMVLKTCPFPSELIVRENRGLSRTLNEGFARSFGEYFAYLGSDDVWLSSFLEKRIKFLQTRKSAALTFGHAFLIDENDQIIDCTANWTQYTDKNILPLLLQGIVPASSSVVYRRSALQNYNWNENSILEDYELYLKLSKNNEFAFDQEILSAWRQHGSNTSGDFGKMLAEWLKAQNRVAPILGITPQELALIQARLKFKSAIDFIRSGNKLEALKLFSANLRGAPSVSAITNTLIRLLIPQKIMNLLGRQRKHLVSKRYQTVRI